MAGQLPIPVKASTQLAELLLHPADLFLNIDPGVNAGLDRCVLGGKAKAVPPHGRQDVVTLHLLVAGDQVDVGVVADMPDMELTRGVRIHRDVVELWLVRIFGDVEDTLGLPSILPFCLDGPVVVFH